MKIISEDGLRNFKFWSGAVDHANSLSLEQLDEVEAILEDLYPDGMTDTQVNDLFWFDFDTVKEWIGAKLQESDLEYYADQNSPVVLSNGLEVELSTSQDWAGTIFLNGEATYEDEDGEENTIDDYVDFHIDDYDQDEAEECFEEALARLKNEFEKQI